MPDPFATSEPSTKKLYEHLLKALKPLGKFEVEPKKTSVHLVRKTAFAGVHPRKQFFLLTIKAENPIDSERVAKSEQVSKNRWHQDVKITKPADVDAELLAWVRKAYELCG